MQPKHYDALVVGAGFSGLYMVYRLRQLGLSVLGFEAGADVGGTWYWNRYPGARCDAESLVYSYSFSEQLRQEWRWSERFATQPEILKYLQHVADRFELRQHFQFNTRVKAAVFDDAQSQWQLTTEQGARFSARFCFMATGCLSVGRVPNIPGLESFQGEHYHTGNWPHAGVDFTGKRVIAIGTGSSGIQAIPLIAQQAAQLTVLQRTPSFSVPARNQPLSDEYIARFNDNYDEIRHLARRQEIIGSGDVAPDPADSPRMSAQVAALSLSDEKRQQAYEARWNHGGAYIVGTFADLMVDENANRTVADFVRGKISEIVSDPETARKLTPTDYPLGAKRICVDTDYYATFNRDNVTLVDLRANAIECITPTGVKLQSGEAIDADAIVFATGFDAMTGALSSIDVVGVQGLKLRDKWVAGPRTYLGLQSAGFPNLFMITGPGSPSVLSNVVISIEQHVEWLVDLVKHMRDHGIEQIQPTVAAEDEWVQHVNDIANATLFRLPNSWYLGANIPGKPRVFMPYAGGTGPYRDTCDKIAAENYRGFVCRIAST